MIKALQKSWFFPAILVVLLFFQLLYSFLFPAVGLNDNWLPVDTYLPKFEVENSDNFILKKVYPLISENYRVNSDVGHYLEVGKNFSPQYFEGHVLLSRPLYPFLIYLVSLPIRLFIDPSYGIIFGVAIMVNFSLIICATLLFFSLLKKVFSLKIAFLSSLLLIFSPMVHSALIQPRAELLTIFSVVVTGYLLYNYINSPSNFKLVIYSLLVGVFMLGKMFFALPLFIGMLAIYFKRYRESFDFFVAQSVPFGLWFLLVTQIWQIPFYVHEAHYYSGGIWIFNIFNWPWHQTYKIFLESLPNFFESLIFSFLLIPVAFSVVGFYKWRHPQKNIFYLGSIASVFIFSLATNIYYTRTTFLLFLVIYPTCILGIEYVAIFLKKYNLIFYPVFYIAILSAIIAISSANVFYLVSYI
jgi:hypothetical protein